MDGDNGSCIMRPFVKYCNNGGSRNVLLIGNLAIKFPKLSSRKFFHAGRCDIMSEASCEHLGNEHLPKVYASGWFGTFIVMERLRPVKNKELFWVNLEEVNAKEELPYMFWTLDAKPENFGYRNTTLVKIDFDS